MLIDTYLKVTENGIEKLPALIELSRRLRSVANNVGTEIDDTYRNLNGMQWLRLWKEHFKKKLAHICH